MKGHSLGYHASVWIARIGIPVGIWFFFEAASGHWLSALLVPKPSLVTSTLWDWLRGRGDSNFYHAFFQTVQQFAVGLFIGTVLGIVFALLVVTVKPLATVVEPAIAALHNVPRITLIPMLVLWFGIGDKPLFVYSTGSAFFPIFFNMVQGWRSADPGMIGQLQILGGNRREIFYHYYLPHGRPYLLSGLAICAPITLVATLIGELIVGTGLGGLMSNYESQFISQGVYAAAVATGVLGLVVNLAVARWGRKTNARVSAF